jgi:hypothetical protein
MGYIGLLLNAPYKIDRLMWMRLIRISFWIVYISYMFSRGLYEPEDILGIGRLKMWVPRILGVLGVL